MFGSNRFGHAQFLMHVLYCFCPFTSHFNRIIGRTRKKIKYTNSDNTIFVSYNKELLNLVLSTVLMHFLYLFWSRMHYWALFFYWSKLGRMHYWFWVEGGRICSRFYQVNFDDRCLVLIGSDLFLLVHLFHIICIETVQCVTCIYISS